MGKRCPVKSVKKSMFQLFLGVIGVAMVLAPALVLQGSNVWNPGGGKKTEETSKAAGASFLKGVGKIYLGLGLMQEGNFAEATDILKEARGDLKSTAQRCKDVSEMGSKDTVILNKLKVDWRPEDKRNKYIGLGAVPSQDSVWPKMAPVVKTGNFKPLVDLCGESITEITTALTDVETAISQRSLPSQLNVWKLMNAMEQSLLKSRYFTIIFTKETK